MIKEFQGEYRFLSNFWPAEVQYQGLIFPTVEHAYQAAKTENWAHRYEIQFMDKPGDAKKFGKKVEIREDWNSIKFHIMKELVEEKFRKPWLQKLLLATGTEELQEGNSWGDTYWGVCWGIGQNKLGQILMQVREEIKRGS